MPENTADPLGEDIAEFAHSSAILAGDFLDSLAGVASGGPARPSPSYCWRRPI